MHAVSEICVLLCAVCFFCSHCTVESLPSTPATQNNYTVTNGNITCVVMTTAMQLTIPYVGQSDNLTATVNITGNVSTTGTCSNNLGQNALNIYFFNDAWNITIVIKNTSDSSFYWSEVTLAYVLDNAHFPNVSAALENVTVQVDTILPNGTEKAAISGSYKCDGSSNLMLDKNITLTLINLQYRAFGTDNSTSFTNTNVQKCQDATLKPETPLGVTVAVGIACGALIVLVIIIYLSADKLLGRKKWAYD